MEFYVANAEHTAWLNRTMVTSSHDSFISRVDAFRDNKR